MRVVAIRTREIAWTLDGRGAAAGRTERRGIVLEVRTDTGITGFGEASPLPGMSRDTLDDARVALGDFASALEPAHLGSLDPFVGARDPDAIMATRIVELDSVDVRDTDGGRVVVELGSVDAIFAAARRHASPSARFAIETALLDALAQTCGTPIAQLLDPTTRSIATSAVVDHSDDALGTTNAKLDAAAATATATSAVFTTNAQLDAAATATATSAVVDRADEALGATIPQQVVAAATTVATSAVVDRAEDALGTTNAQLDAAAATATATSARRDNGAQLDAAATKLATSAVVDDADDARAAVAAGARVLKIKVSDAHEGARVARIAAAAPDHPLRLDANRAWPRERVRARLAELAILECRASFEFVEEPCVDAHLLLLEGEPLPLPIALDESLVDLSSDALDRALRSPSLAALVLKPTLLGGFAACLALAARARAAGVAAVVTHALESPIGAAACFELARAIGGPQAHGVRARESGPSSSVLISPISTRDSATDSDSAESLATDSATDSAAATATATDSAESPATDPAAATVTATDSAAATATATDPAAATVPTTDSAAATATDSAESPPTDPAAAADHAAATVTATDSATTTATATDSAESPASDPAAATVTATDSAESPATDPAAATATATHSADSTTATDSAAATAADSAADSTTATDSAAATATDSAAAIDHAAATVTATDSATTTATDSAESPATDPAAATATPTGPFGADYNILISREQRPRSGSLAGRAAIRVATPTTATIESIHAALDTRRPIALLHPALPGAELSRQRAAVEAAELRDDDALVLFTSGSTGLARGVVLSRAAIVAAADASAAHLGWRDDDRWLLALSTAHAGGAAVVVRCHLAGKPIALLERWDRAAAAAALEQCTLASLVPTQLADLLADPAWRPPARLRAVLLGGAAASPALLASAAARGVPFLATYGMTESFGQLATAPLDRAGDPSAPLVPLRGVELVAGTRAEPAAIRVRGPTLATRYLDGTPIAPEHVTSDLGFLDRGLHVVGRADDMIITGGENVSPATVEAVLAATPGVRAACAFAIPDETWGQIVGAAIAAERLDHDAIVAWRAALPAHARPRELAVVHELPLLATGKLDRRAAARLPRARVRY